MKFDVQIKGIIIAIYLIALDPSALIDPNIKQNITNGNENINRSFIRRLQA